MVQIVHRHTFTIAEAISALIPDELTDCDKFEIRVDDGMVVVDVVAPADISVAPTASQVGPQASSQDVNDLETKASDEADNTVPERKGGPMARRAAFLCTKKGFRTFISLKFNRVLGSSEEAADWLRGYCGVTSRADLDHEQEAGEKFRDVEKSYALWVEGYD